MWNFLVGLWERNKYWYNRIFINIYFYFVILKLNSFVVFNKDVSNVVLRLEVIDRFILILKLVVFIY